MLRHRAVIATALAAALSYGTVTVAQPRPCTDTIGELTKATQKPEADASSEKLRRMVLESLQKARESLARGNEADCQKHVGHARASYLMMGLKF